jgi:hypothetical protein
VFAIDADLDLHALEATPSGFLRMRYHIVDRCDRNRHRQGNGIAHAPAQKVVDRRLEQLTDDVVQRHVDGGLGGIRSARELHGRIHQLMRPIDVDDLQPDERRRQQVVNHGAERRAVSVPDHADLAEAGDPLRGFHLDDAEGGIVGKAESAAEW